MIELTKGESMNSKTINRGNVKIIKVDKPKEGWDRYDDVDENPYDIDNINKLTNPPELVVYWYGAGCYEGAGYAIFMREGKWALRDLGHCSCYGPFDDVDCTEYIYDSLKELYDNCSEDVQKHIFTLTMTALDHNLKSKE